MGRKLGKAKPPAHPLGTPFADGTQVFSQRVPSKFIAKPRAPKTGRRGK